MAVVRKPELSDPESQRLFDELHELHLQAGAPSIRAVQERIRSISRDTVYRVLAGPKIPPWTAVEPVVRALDGDPNRFRALWIAAHRPPTPAASVTGFEPVEFVTEPITDPMRLVVVDGQPLYRQALVTVLGSAGCSVVGVAGDGVRGVTLAVELLPDVVLMDLRTPVLDGVEATAEIRRRQPAVRVLALTALGVAEEAATALAVGAAGFLTKSADGAEIIAAVRTVHEGRTYVSKEIQAALRSRRTVPARTSPALSGREREVIVLMANGLTDEAIAYRLGISVRTIRRILAQILTKTGERTRAGLARYAAERGITRPRLQDHDPDDDERS